MHSEVEELFVSRNMDNMSAQLKQIGDETFCSEICKQMVYNKGRLSPHAS